ncbi:hypothetical protein LCGC14_0712400 [marine sediment metagenome]|uniref:HTH asnC-type domain-containing protein n=1 Tax=marine sediment metagenome TaxID=412755 RepID=A0A0F9R020_9ZZZZ|nr:Lrp/AsnC family transcriptional regulator [archaeon]
MNLFDEIDCEILNLLQVNCRMTLTDISKHVNLSIDAVKNRINKMQENRVFWPKIQIRPRNFGFKNIVEVKISLKYKSEDNIREFIEFLRQHPRVVEIFSISGKWDFSIVIIAKDAIDLGKISSEIRIKFGEIIRSWTESLTTSSYKFEYYDMRKLMGHRPTRVKFNF